MSEEKKDIFKEGIGHTKKWISESMSVKIVFIMLMIILMLIPEQMVLDIIHERMQRSEEVKTELHSKQGGEQEIHGPVLSVLYGQGKERTWLHLYPDLLKINAETLPEMRKRGIYETVLYRGLMDISGTFALPDQNSHIDLKSINWDKAYISFGVLDPSGIIKDVKVTAGTEEIAAAPGIPVNTPFSKGFHIPVKLDPANKTLDFSTNLTVKGSKLLQFVPAGQQTVIKIKSTWKDPGFIGSFLTSSHEVSEEGFTAEWIVHDLQRDFKNMWVGASHSEKYETVGVKLLKLNDVYQRILRVIKYAILFISFTFAALFISERLTRIKIHPLQYLLTGLASLLFYILLLSLSEHLTFNASYGITSAIVTVMIAAYAKGIFKNIKMAWTLGGVSTLLYLFLFGTLQLEDYALLMGSFGLLMTLGAVMFLTRDLNKEQQLVSA